MKVSTYISVIVPCYNEEQVISETYKQLSEQISVIGKPYEIIFINDGSKDATIDILKKIAETDNRVKIINFSRNFGHQCAVSAGLKYCTGEIAAIIDADLQDPPAVILEMVKIMETEQANVVYGVRKNRAGESKFKLLTARWFYRTLNAMSEVKFPLDTGDFRIVDRKIINQFNELKEKNKYIRGLISWMGFKQVPCYYDRDKRFAGETKYPLRKMIKFALTGLFYFSKKPLQLATSLGTFCIGLGLLYFLWMLIAVIFSIIHTVPGWLSIIGIIIFFGGIQLLTIGVLGRYIGNIFDETKERPEFIVNETINF
ncbi:MAG: glycosyltransferase family 2 protein [Bacteroidetes bacterium]|nr:glycosyltransferase family 2 protein [Bacteroidota bacterium]MCL2303458.1 glycosyltransferase family 2 protein [Lentimicrobiaceae bacterium]